MKKIDVEKLSQILGRNDFRYNKCSHGTLIKLVRIQIQVDPVAESVKKARELTEKRFMGDKLRKYLEKYQGGELEKEQVPEFNELYKSYERAYVEAILPTLEEKAKISFDKLSVKEYGELFESNTDWMSGDIPKFLFQTITDDSLKDEVDEKEQQ